MAASDEASLEARQLLRSARVGTLATQDCGQPFAGLVTPATTGGMSILLLLSELSLHTHHLRADPRCAVMVAGEAAEANPQTAPRVTLTGAASVDDDPSLRARFLAVHPYAALYAGFGDFHLWRIVPDGGLYVGGFARAFRLRPEQLVADHAVVAALDQAADDIMAHCNADHPDALAAITAEPGEWRMAGVDADGFDVAQGERVKRVAWSKPVDGPDAVRRELIILARAARARQT